MRAIFENRLARLLLILFLALFLALGGLFLWRGHGGQGGGDGIAEDGGPRIGGPFSLTDDRGQAVTDQTYRGKIMLVYFGYTWCPDVCPTELQAMSDALDILGAEADKIAPLFITVDPARDTVPVMAQYVAHFNPRLRGLTGSPEQVEAAARAYRVYAQKDPGATGKDYAVNHSSLIFAMDRNGKFLTHFSNGAPAEAIAAKLKPYL